MRPDNERSRPTANRAASNVSNLDDTDSTPRCIVCGYPLVAARSIELGIGVKCRRRQGEVIACVA